MGAATRSYQRRCRDGVRVRKDSSKPETVVIGSLGESTHGSLITAEHRQLEKFHLDCGKPPVVILQLGALASCLPSRWSCD